MSNVIPTKFHIILNETNRKHARTTQSTELFPQMAGDAFELFKHMCSHYRSVRKPVNRLQPPWFSVDTCAWERRHGVHRRSNFQHQESDSSSSNVDESRSLGVESEWKMWAAQISASCRLCRSIVTVQIITKWLAFTWKMHSWSDRNNIFNRNNRLRSYGE